MSFVKRGNETIKKNKKYLKKIISIFFLRIASFFSSSHFNVPGSPKINLFVAFRVENACCCRLGKFFAQHLTFVCARMLVVYLEICSRGAHHQRNLRAMQPSARSSGAGCIPVAAAGAPLFAAPVYKDKVLARSPSLRAKNVLSLALARICVYEIKRGEKGFCLFSGRSRVPLLCKSNLAPVRLLETEQRNEEKLPKGFN